MQAKKLKLLDIQIDREEQNVKMDAEFHKARMELIRIQIKESKQDSDM